MTTIKRSEIDGWRRRRWCGCWLLMIFGTRFWIVGRQGGHCQTEMFHRRFWRNWIFDSEPTNTFWQDKDRNQWHEFRLKTTGQFLMIDHRFQDFLKGLHIPSPVHTPCHSSRNAGLDTDLNVHRAVYQRSAPHSQYQVLPRTITSVPPIQSLKVCVDAV